MAHERKRLIVKEMDKEDHAPKDDKMRINIDPTSEEDLAEDSSDVPGNLSLSLMSHALGFFCFPLTALGSIFTVQQNQEVVILNFGKYVGVVREPGIHCSNCWGRELIPVSKAKVTTELPVSKVIDKNGNPVMVSGVVFYYFSNTKKAALDILDPQAFVKDQATAVMKQIVSQYPYEHHQSATQESDHEGDSDEELPCLKSDTAVVSAALVQELQKRVRVAGAQIDNFRFNEVSYAPEVSAGLLKRQQAEAIITARTTLVEGAVKISSSAVNRLEHKGVAMQVADKTRLVSNLLTVICAEQQVQPTLMLGAT